MDIDNYLPQDAQSYIVCVRQLAALTNKAMNEFKNNTYTSEGERNKSLHRLADAVETISCLRGDSGLFYAGRPKGLIEYQKEMYQIEGVLRTRLLSLGYVYPSR